MHYGIMKLPKNFDQMLNKRGYSTEIIEEMWKWYDSGPNRNDLVLMRNQLGGGAHHICLISSEGYSGLSFDSAPVITLTMLLLITAKTNIKF